MIRQRPLALAGRPAVKAVLELLPRLGTDLATARLLLAFPRLQALFGLATPAGCQHQHVQQPHAQGEGSQQEENQRKVHDKAWIRPGKRAASERGKQKIGMKKREGSGAGRLLDGPLPAPDRSQPRQ